ncbi:MAG TPA: tetratricopeptide repeat protein [Luteimonas sp.]|nr:tetratricopeptide repeat protein [Luteimonas sp.]
MSPVLLLSILLQIACAVHAVRSGRPMYWLFILLIGSYIAVAVYLLAEVLPGLRNNRAARQAVRGVQDRIDPTRRTRAAALRLDVADTLQNRRLLAEESLRAGDHAHAAELFRSSLKGLYATDPELMLGLATAQLALGDAHATKATLDALIAANPTFRSSDGHLLYARAVEQLGDGPAALHEYEALVQGYPGEEARVRYALLLKQQGQADKAREVFDETLRRSAASPGYYRREQREWIDIAKREMA